MANQKAMPQSQQQTSNNNKALKKQSTQAKSMSFFKASTTWPIKRPCLKANKSPCTVNNNASSQQETTANKQQQQST